MNKTEQKSIIFGGGCFWCTEAVFQMIRGVSRVVSGYAGGKTPNPTYEEVSSGQTGHAEVIRVDYDPREVSQRDLLAVFFGSHDPTTTNRQGADVGTQYRSIIVVSSEEEKQEVEVYIRELNDSTREGRTIVTEVVKSNIFYEAEKAHQDYYSNHSGNQYCELVINPKLEKAQKEFTDLLRQKPRAG